MIENLHNFRIFAIYFIHLYELPNDLWLMISRYQEILGKSKNWEPVAQCPEMKYWLAKRIKNYAKIGALTIAGKQPFFIFWLEKLEKLVFLTSWYALRSRTCAYQGVRDVSFLEKNCKCTEWIIPKAFLLNAGWKSWISVMFISPVVTEWTDWLRSGFIWNRQH